MKSVYFYSKKNALWIGIALALISLLLTWFYRPYIYENQIFDFHFADTIGSWFCIPSATFFFYGIRKKQFAKILNIVLFAYIIYEILTALPYHGTFDSWDILAMVLSYSICLGCYFYGKKK
ncbi:MAG: hypothetical protein KGV44_07505 [Flavobacteriaceae bacterium]|nr:hypothetical protein [Flavobacteriaceae bacterium]